jgi:hypothetical protein
MRKAGALRFFAVGRIRFVAFLQAAHAIPIIVFFFAISIAFPWIRQTPAAFPRMPHERVGRKTEPNQALVKLIETIRMESRHSARSSNPSFYLFSFCCYKKYFKTLEPKLLGVCACLHH